jgi:hypothetical protein
MSELGIGKLHRIIMVWVAERILAEQVAYHII